MEDEKVVAWFNGAPLMVYTTVAEQFGLKNGSQIADKVLYTRIVEENTNQSRAACSFEARATGQECIS